MEHQDCPSDSAESLNKALLSLYKSKKSEFTVQIARCIDLCGWSADQVSKPFFMKVDEAYTKAQTKILFVVRETFGWGKYDWRDNATALMNSYEEISLYKNYYNSSFWRFREVFSREFGISKDDLMRTTLLTNLSKIDVGKKQPTGRQFDSLMQVFISLLVAEIEIIKPDVVLIMTKDGSYNRHLNNYGWFHNEPNKPYIEINLPQLISNVSADDAIQSFEMLMADKNWVKLYARLTGLDREPVIRGKIDRLTTFGRLPYHTYQICHPNALRRKAGGYTKHADELINTLVDQIKLQ